MRTYRLSMSFQLSEKSVGLDAQDHSDGHVDACHDQNQVRFGILDLVYRGFACVRGSRN
jgi:hypothetical protein